MSNELPTLINGDTFKNTKVFDLYTTLKMKIVLMKLFLNEVLNDPNETKKQKVISFFKKAFSLTEKQCKNIINSISGESITGTSGLRNYKVEFLNIFFTTPYLFLFLPKEFKKLERLVMEQRDKRWLIFGGLNSKFLLLPLLTLSSSVSALDKPQPTSNIHKGLTHLKEGLLGVSNSQENIASALAGTGINPEKITALAGHFSKGELMNFEEGIVDLAIESLGVIRSSNRHTYLETQHQEKGSEIIVHLAPIGKYPIKLILSRDDFNSFLSGRIDLLVQNAVKENTKTLLSWGAYLLLDILTSTDSQTFFDLDVTKEYIEEGKKLKGAIAEELEKKKEEIREAAKDGSTGLYKLVQGTAELSYGLYDETSSAFKSIAGYTLYQYGASTCAGIVSYSSTISATAYTLLNTLNTLNTLLIEKSLTGIPILLSIVAGIGRGKHGGFSGGADPDLNDQLFYGFFYILNGISSIDHSRKDDNTDYQKHYQEVENLLNFILSKQTVLINFSPINSVETIFIEAFELFTKIEFNKLPLILEPNENFSKLLEFTFKDSTNPNKSEEIKDFVLYLTSLRDYKPYETETFKDRFGVPNYPEINKAKAEQILPYLYGGKKSKKKKLRSKKNKKVNRRTRKQ